MGLKLCLVASFTMFNSTDSDALALMTFGMSHGYYLSSPSIEVSTTVNIANTGDDIIYQTQRTLASNRQSSSLAYDIPVCWKWSTSLCCNIVLYRNS